MVSPGWVVYAFVVLVVSGVIGMHLQRFREAYTEMTGMMAGMTMGMLNGFVLGFAAAAAANSMFWGNLFGILLGIVLGLYFGRPGGLMGIMDGAMGGVMGGSMGAMLAVMVAFPKDGLVWTAILLTAIYGAGMLGLVVLIERSAPGHAALHRLAPMFTRAMAIEVAEEAEEVHRMREARQTAYSTNGEARTARQKKLADYYALLSVPRNAGEDQILEAYDEKIIVANDAEAARLERALAVLTDNRRRQAYDRRLNESEIVEGEGGDFYPPPKQKAEATTLASTVSSTPSTQSQAVTMRVVSQDVPQSANETVTIKPAGSRGAGKSDLASPNGTNVAPGGQGKGKHSPQTQPQNSKQGKQTQGSKGNAQSAQRQGQGQGSREGHVRSARKQQVSYTQTEQGPQNRVVPVSWVGGLAFVVILVLVGWWVFSAGMMRPAGASGGTSGSSVGAGGETQAQLEQAAVVAPVGADGRQTVDVVLNSATFQYEPKVVKVKQGIPVHFNLSVINGDPG